MATSSPEDAPRGMEFLYSLNRLNVATSRAKCLAILVASPRLFEPLCRSPRRPDLGCPMCSRHFGSGGYMVEIHPARIPGRWSDGRALDVHTVSSTFLGDDEFGHRLFDTTRSPIGELLYRLKYKGDRTVVSEIADVAATFVREWQPAVDLLVPVPPSRDRAVQPVLMVGAELASRLAVPFCPECVHRTGLHNVDAEAVRGKWVLLFDDLFRSGATMNSITAAMYENAGAGAVYALTLTRTRSAQ